MIGKTYILSKNSESTYWLCAFENGLIGDLTEVTVNKTVVDGTVVGASEVTIDGKIYSKPSHYFWCFFTECMVKDSRYNLTEKVVHESVEDFLSEKLGTEFKTTPLEELKAKVVHESAGVVGVSRCDSTKAYLDTYGKKPLEQRYNEWVLENIHIYDLFCKFTLEAINAGHAKISHWLIVNRLRWEVEVVTKGMCEDDKEYKISNDYIAFLARDFIKDHPEHKDIFNLKQMKRV